LSSFAPQFSHLVFIGSQTIFPPMGGRQHSWWAIEWSNGYSFKIDKDDFVQEWACSCWQHRGISLKKMDIFFIRSHYNL